MKDRTHQQSEVGLVPDEPGLLPPSTALMDTLEERAVLVLPSSPPKPPRAKRAAVKSRQRQHYAIDRRYEGFFVRFLAKPSFQSQWALIAEVLPEGLNLFVDQCFDSGAVLAVELRSPDPFRSGIQLMTVREVVPTAPGCWLLHCSMMHPHPFDSAQRTRRPHRCA